MSRNARIEEVSDSDSDPSDQDPADFDPSDALIRPANIAPPTSPPQGLQPQFKGSANLTKDKEKYKEWQCLYAVYFDATRTRTQGRRIGKELAVENPLAREIAEAVKLLGLNVMFDPGRQHPKDWANPGRVKVLLKENGRVVDKRIANSGFMLQSMESRDLWLTGTEHHLYILVAKYLKANPTTQNTPMRREMHITGMPMPDKPIPPAVPRGWKMGSILPIHSPALSGGGVSENMFKEMMQEMQSGGPVAQLENSGSGKESNKKKEKRRVKQ